jgi:hypothetical protein
MSEMQLSTRVGPGMMLSWVLTLNGIRKRMKIAS